MTVEEYLALPEEKPYLEYVDGEVVEKPVAGVKHGVVTDEVIGALRAYRSTRGGFSGPEIRVRFSTQRGAQFRVPDSSYWAPGRPMRDGNIGLPPTLAVEVRSPDQTAASQRRKCRSMHEDGTDVCWLFDPDHRTVEVFEGGTVRVLRGAAELTSAHLPGFALRLADIFAVLDELPPA
jgi:Uma2 family endonuclease